MATGDMIKETPIASHPDGEDSNEKVMSSLKEMEDTLQTILESTGTGKSSEGGVTHEVSEKGSNRKLLNRDGTTITWADDNDIDLDQGWEIQEPKNVKTTKSGKQDSKDDKSG